MTTANLVYALIIYGVGLSVLLFLSHILADAGRRAGGGAAVAARQAIAGLWIWFALATAYALVVGDGFLWLAPAIALPIAVGLAVTYLEPVKTLLRHVSVPKLVGVQIYRNAGAVFLLAHFVYGHEMSRQFALNAGIGDVITGLLAIPAAAAAYYRIPFWRLIVVLWCALGVGDLILAPITAAQYGGMRIDDFPINAIPLFFGPPLGILLHLIALRSLQLQAAPACETNRHEPRARRPRTQ